MKLLKHLTSSPARTSASPAEVRAVANVASAVFKRKQWCVEHLVLRSVASILAEEVTLGVLVENISEADDVS